MGRIGVLVAALAAMIALLTGVTDTAPAQGADPTMPQAAPEFCAFQHGFLALREQVGAEVVGECREDERATADGSEQRTTGGLMVWNRSINVASFTDGHQTWVAGPNGVEVRPNGERFAWEEEALREAKAAALAQRLTAPSPRELALIYVERVRGNNQVSLEKIYVTAYYHAEYAVQQWLSGARATLAGWLERAISHAA